MLNWGPEGEVGPLLSIGEAFRALRALLPQPPADSAQLFDDRRGPWCMTDACGSAWQAVFIPPRKCAGIWAGEIESGHEHGTLVC